MFGTFCGHHVLHIPTVFLNEMPFQEVLRTFSIFNQIASHIWIRAEKWHFVKFRGDFLFKIPMIYGCKQSTLHELHHISTILARIKHYMYYCLLQGLASLKFNIPCAKFISFCSHHVISYTDNVFKRGAILVVLRVYLTLPIRLHRIFESVLKRWISSSFVVIFNPKCRWYMDANNLPYVNYVTFRRFWHVLCHVGRIACYRA